MPKLSFRSYWCLTHELLVHCLQYEPELFPGLIYRMKQPKIVLLIFVSGKIVLTGAKVWPLRLHIQLIITWKLTAFPTLYNLLITMKSIEFGSLLPHVSFFFSCR